MDDAAAPRPDTASEGRATIRLLFLTALFDELSNEPRSVIDPLLREHGFHRSQMATPYERVPLHRYVALMEHVAKKLERPFLGLEMGARFGLTELGPFHALLRSAGNLRAALDCLTLFQSRLQSQTLLDSSKAADVTTYSYRIEDRAIWPRRQDAEFTMAGFATLIKELTGSKWSPMEIRFEHSIAGREERLAQFFRAPLQGNQVANQLLIGNEELDRPFSGAIPSEDGKLKSILECHLLDLMGPELVANKGLVAQAREIIARWLGRTHVDCATVAGELNLSERSLRRRLMEEGTSFRSLLQEARQARALTMLEANDLPLSVAAEQLGYSDSATFSRAFKDWTGMSPGRFSKKAS